MIKLVFWATLKDSYQIVQLVALQGDPKGA